MPDVLFVKKELWIVDENVLREFSGRRVHPVLLGYSYGYYWTVVGHFTKVYELTTRRVLLIGF